MENFINVSSLSYSENNSTILKNINFSIQTSEIICILGNNGSGKSTLLKLCAGLLQPSYGSISFNYFDIFKFQDAERAKLIAWLPQELSRPYNMTLLEFMALNHAPYREEEFKLFEVGQFKQKQISTLSGGEWKRAQLARLWQTNCRLMLLDEPDSDLDLRHKKKLSHFCKEYVYHNSAIMVIVTHDIVFAQEVADKIFALADGYLVWNSKSDEFWNSKIINKIFSTKVV